MIAQTPESSVRVIPAPRELKQIPGTFRITSQTVLVLGEGAEKADRFAADQVNEFLAEMGSAPLRIVTEESTRKRPSSFLLLGTPRSRWGQQFLKDRGVRLTDAMKSEGYVLDVGTDGIVIMAESARGRFYGVQTLVQLLRKDKKTLNAPRVFVRDWPLLAIRGITDDLSRGQVSTMENFKKIVRFLSRNKLNVYSPYIEDIFVFTNHPLIGKDRGALTAQEVRELDAYARQYHVELIPIFETLGHWENILLMPEYSGYGEFPGAHTVNVSDERVYALLDEMIGELAAAFSSPYFNMAADESWDVGLGANKERVAQSDIATVHAEHYKRLFAMLKKYGKTPLMYGDIILNNPEILGKIPKDVIIVDWQYWAGQRYPSPEVFRDAGFPYIVSPAVWNFTGPFPNYLNTVVNVRNFTRDGYLNGSLGVLTSNWNDFGGEALRELNYSGFAWTAECAWQPLGADIAEFNTRFFPQFFGSEEAGRAAQMIYTILSDPFNQMHWHDLWRHPLLPLRPNGMNHLWRIQSIESTMPFAQRLIDEAQREALRNNDQFPFLRFVTNLNLWFAQKLRVGEQIKQWQSDSVLQANPDSLRHLVVPAARSVVEHLRTVQREFKAQWLTTNRPDNLVRLMNRYDRQAAYWEEIADDPGKTDPTIPSQWLYHPSANPRNRDSSATQVPKAFFRLVLDGSSGEMPAGLQLIADTYARVLVNGTQIGEVLARPSLSLLVEEHRVRQWDLTPHLRPKGRNVIAIEGANYNPFGSSGINVLGYRVDASGNYHTVVLDTLVKVSDKAAEGWTREPFDDFGWVPAAPMKYPNPVIAPSFRNNRPSWIER